MSHDFLGTFNASQFNRLRDYLRAQVQIIDARIQHLKAERARVGDLAFAYDSGGVPTGFANDPPQTYCGKLFGAYEALGGDVEFDLQVRSTSQPVFRMAGDETVAAQMMSNGEILGVHGKADATSAVLMQQLKGWVADDLHYRRDALERKIRRAIDYAEQLDAEISQLLTIKADSESTLEKPTTMGSLEYMISTIQTLISTPDYFAATDDSNSPDPHGKLSRAPVAAYMPGGGGKGTTPITYQRTLDGVTKPEE